MGWGGRTRSSAFASGASVRVVGFEDLARGEVAFSVGAYEVRLERAVEKVPPAVFVDFDRLEFVLCIGECGRESCVV